MKQYNLHEKTTKNTGADALAGFVTEKQAARSPDQPPADYSPEQIEDLANTISAMAGQMRDQAKRQRERNAARADGKERSRAMRAGTEKARRAIEAEILAHGPPSAELLAELKESTGASGAAWSAACARALGRRGLITRFTRDREIMARARRGQSNQEIAAALGLHRNTISAAIRRGISGPRVSPRPSSLFY